MDDQTRKEFTLLFESVRDIRDRLVTWSEAIENVEDWSGSNPPMSKAHLVLELFLKLRKDIDNAKQLAKNLGSIDIMIRNRRCHYKLPRLIANELFLATEIIGWGTAASGFLDHETLQGSALEHYEKRVNWAAQETASELLRLQARLNRWLNWQLPPGPPATYLSITLDQEKRMVHRNGATADFCGKDLPWQFFTALYAAGSIGVGKKAMELRIWPKIGGDHYNLSKRTKSIVKELHVLIDGEDGKYILKSNPAYDPPPPAPPAEEPMPF